MNEMEIQLDSFMLYCDSKHLSKKTLASYEQTLKLFTLFLKEEFKIVEPSKVKPVHVRHYIKYLRERGKYTVVAKETSKKINHPDHRHDFNKQVSDTTIANYLIYFGFKMANDLKRWFQYRDRYSDSPYLFPTIRGIRLDVRNFERSLKQAGNKVGMNIHPHLLRKNFAKYYLIEGNGDFATLSRLLGYSSVDVTMKAYLDFTDQEIGRKYQKHSPLSNLDI